MLLRYNKLWREAATVLLVSKSSNQSFPSRLTFDYKVLMLERSSKSKFMPKAFVFPGGAIAESDIARDWLSIYSTAGYTLPSEDTGSRQDCPMFSQNRQWPMSNKVAFKINAIRETFEETGILIYQKWKTSPGKLEKSVLSEWKTEVYKNDSRFLDMCNDLKVIPDIWSLHSWSNWLTPTNMNEIHSGKRFDTAFFICLHPKTINAVHDEQEIVSTSWCDPLELLEQYKEGKLWLAPPQVYEMRRLLNFRTFEALEKFVKTRETDITERLLPVRMTCSDIKIAALPGDDLYPQECDLDIEGKFPAPVVGCSSEESRNRTTSLHRFEFHTSFDCRILSNVSPKFGMPLPKIASGEE